ncbi:hypothetical protein AB6A40_008232 [Gnathostoma spinigerum]|uniref:Uncharacterized protein n=1 Tax=Gnathostoma spinigerum TaxID=75299 RepID=A0ABD6EWT2_9BILA
MDESLKQKYFSCGNIVRVDSRGRYDASLTSYKQTLPKSTGNERLIRNPSSIKHQSDRECYDKVVRHISDYCDRQLSESDKNDGWSTIRSECDNRQHIAIIPREYSTIGHRPPTPDCPVLRVMRSGDSHYSTIGPNCTINSLNSAARSNPQQSIVPVVRRRIFNRLRNTHKEPSNTTPTIHAYSNPADRSVRELFDDLNHLSVNNSRSLAYDRSCNSDIDNRTSQYLDAIEDAYTIMPLLASNTLRGESVTFPPADVNSVNLSQNGTLKSNIFRNTALRNGTLKPASFDLDNYDGKLHTLTKHDKKTRSSLNVLCTPRTSLHVLPLSCVCRPQCILSCITATKAPSYCMLSNP